MYHNNRQALILAILLGALSVFLLSACGVADTGQASTAVSTAIGATADPAATVEPAATAASTPDPVATATATTDPAATATTDPAASPWPTADPAATASPPTDPTLTPVPTATDDTDPFTGTDELTETGDLTSTTTLTVSHPVALALADYFGVPAAEIFAAHQDGQGFGEIARAYFLAQELAADGDPTNDLTADQILAMHQGGMGWGQVVRSLGLPQSNRNRNLGLIMSGRGPKSDTGGDPATVTTPQNQPGPAAKPHTSGGNGGNNGKGNGGGNSGKDKGGKDKGGNGGGNGKKNK
jgi:hypothetical protein